MSANWSRRRRGASGGPDATACSPPIPQSPLGADALAGFEALRFFPYDPAFRVTGTVVATEPAVREIDSSTGERIRFRQFGRVEFELSGEQSLPLYWLEGYGGGVFLPFADADQRARQLRRRPLSA